MAENKMCRVQKKICSRLSVATMSILVASTALGNFVSAAEVYPTITPAQNEIKTPTKWIGDLLSGFANFIKSGLKQSTSENNYSFLTEKSVKITEQWNSANQQNHNLSEFSFVDIANDENRVYIQALADKGIVSTVNEKFYPNNFIRLNEVTKMFVNAIRLNKWYSLSSSFGLTDKNYFNSIVPKYYNTAYEMWLLKWIDDLENYQRFVTIDDLEWIVRNLEKEYPEFNHLHDYEPPELFWELRRSYVSKVVYSLLVDSGGGWDSVVAYGDSVNHEFGEAIETLANLGISNTENTNFYPDQNITRGDFIVLLVKSFIQRNPWKANLSLDNLEFNISDLDYNSQYAPYVVYAKEKGFIDSLINTNKDWTKVNLRNTISKHDAYSILSKVAKVDFSYGESTKDTQSLTRGEAAQLMVDCFWLSNKSVIVSWANSQLWNIIDEVKQLISKWKEIVAIL